MAKGKDQIKVILLYVASIDGKTTKWGNDKVHEWTSKEDAEYFQNTLKKSKLVVMGSNTFNVVHPQPTAGTLRIVLTKNPKNYQKFRINKQLEFSSEDPKRLRDRLEKEGYKEMFLVSGKKLTTDFFSLNLIDELWLTIEPKLFGIGNAMIDNKRLNIFFELVSIKKLNKNGTLLLKYKVQR